MTKKLLIALITGTLSVFAVACGDAGEPIQGEADLGEEVAGEHDAVDEVGNDEEDHENREEVDPEPEAPFCGDGILDDDEQCDDGNDVDGDGCSTACEVEVFEAFAAGNVRIDLVVDDLNSNEEPLEETCLGAIELDVVGESLVGDGRCFLSANFMDYTLDASVDQDGAVQGEIAVVLNGRSHDLALTGSLTNGSLSLTFDGVTILVGSIRGIWDGRIDAEFD